MKLLSFDSIANYDLASLPLVILTLFAIYSLKSIIMVIPGMMLYVIAGIVFPPGWAILITYLCLSLELTIGYMNGKKLGEGKVNERLTKNKRVAKFLENRKGNLPSLCFLSRVLPIPVDLLSLFFGAVKMPFGVYLFISLLGLSPTMIPYVIAGSSISNPLSAEFLIPFGISFSITIIVFIISNQIIKKKKSGAAL